MMNKILAKMTKEESGAATRIITIATLAVTVILLAASIIISVLGGLNFGAGLDDSKMITVSVNSFVYNNEQEALEETCEEVFEKAGLDVEYVYRSEMNGDNREISYVFDAKTDDKKLVEAKETLATKLNEEAAKDEDESALSGAIVNLASSSEEVKSGIASSRLWRAAIAVGVFAVLSFVYVAIRHRLSMAFVALATPVVAAALTTSLVLIARIPVTNAIFYAVLVSAMVASAFVMMILCKIRDNGKEDGYANADALTLVKDSLASKWIIWTSVALGVTLVLVGAIATAAMRYFALASLIGVVVATFIGLMFAPSAAIVLLSSAQAKDANKNVSGYVGAKKEEKETADDNADEE